MEAIDQHLPLSPDLNRERLDTLKRLLPDLFTAEGRLNADELRRLVDSAEGSTWLPGTTLGGIDQTERYEFRWFGKAQAKRNAFTPARTTLVYDEKRSVNPDASENLLIEGENLEVLKLLLAAYREKIKCIYIDPPYNTGKDFVYSDNYTEDKRPYWENTGVTENGVKVDTNTDSSGRYHSDWLNLMYSRLLVARDLLTPDGVIFMSIDDSEICHLRKLCDEVFGEDGFIQNILWKKRSTPPNDKIIGANHDYVLIYCKDKEQVKLNLRQRSQEQLDRFKNPDNHPKGVWASGDLMANVKGGRYVASLYFPIVNPNTGEEHYPSSNGNWRFSKDTIAALIANDEIYFGEDGKGRPKLKRFLTDVKEGMTYPTIWDFVPLNSSGSDEMAKLLGNMNIFDNPKPTGLLREIVKLGAGDDSVILDFFGGSGSTAQAVMELNQEDGGNRKFILVQIPELTDPNSEAHKAGYGRISDITIERCKRVVAKLTAEQKAKNPLFNQDGAEVAGLGFRVFKLQKSNFPRTEWAPDPALGQDENITAFKRYIAEKEAQLVTPFNRADLMTEILLKRGYPLTYTTEKVDIDTANEIVRASSGPSHGGDKTTLICLDAPILPETVGYFKEHTAEKFICLERALDTTAKWNLKHYLGDNLFAF